MQNLEKLEVIETGSRMVFIRGWRGLGGEWKLLVRGYTLPARRGINAGDLMYSMVITVKNILYSMLGNGEESTSCHKERKR